MGNLNCCQENKYRNEDNNKIYQINRTIYSKKNKEKEDLNDKCEILSYDIEENILLKYYIKIPILKSLKGISELNLNSKLYLCGNSSLNDDSSSYLFQLNFKDLSTKILVNSKYCHYFPSLIAINNDKIICIGGKKHVECEIYDINIDHWTLMPDLPEERYKSTLCYDYKNKYLYLFGGINSEKRNKKYIEKDNFLRISSKNYSFPIWEKIFLETKIENKLLNRISSATIFLGDYIIIIGGQNEEGKKLKNISKFDVDKYRIESSGHQLEFPAKFINYNILVDYKYNFINEKNFFYLFEGKTKEIQHNIPKSKNFVDHSFIRKDKKNLSENRDNKSQILYAVLTSNNEIYILQGIEKSFDKTSSMSINALSTKNNISANLYISDSHRIEKFIIIQHLTNIFDNKFSLSTKLKVVNQNNYYNGLIIGNLEGDLLFLGKIENKNNQNQNINLNSINSKTNYKNNVIYQKIRVVHRKIPSECTGISFNYDESILCVAFKNNEISYCDLKNSFDKIKENNFDLKFHLLCEGYHHSPVTSMDTTIQRNILVTSSTKDSSVKIWNYITGLSEYCSLIFSEETQENKQILKNFNILSLALHPSGYYLAMSNEEMIWFFFICYKKLKFYGTEKIKMSNSLVKEKNTTNKRNDCHILKFANGGHVLVAGNIDNFIFIIKSYSREVLNTIKLDSNGKINDIVFSYDDNLIYVTCSDGAIFEINLIYQTNKLLVKQDNINFSDCFFYMNEEIIGGKNIKYYNLLICGNDILNNNYSITEISYTLQLKKNDRDINISNLTNLNEKVTCVISIKPEKHDYICIVCGTLNGKIILVQSPIFKAEYKYDEIYVHKNKITQLIYIKETHLLFSSGEDGNVFMYSIQEIFSQETFYENQISQIGQITTFLDVGLGDNVLMPIWEIDKLERTKGKKHMLEKNFEEEKKEILKNNEKEIQKIIKEKKEKQIEELRKMLNKIDEVDLKIEQEKEEHKDNYDFMMNEINKKQNGEASLYEQACYDYEKEINEIKTKLQYIENMHDEEIDRIEKLYRGKFYDLQIEFENKTNEIMKEKENILLKYEKEQEDKSCFITNLEVGNEIDNKKILIEQDKMNEENKKNINKKIEEIKLLKQRKADLELVLQDKEKDISELLSKVNYIEDLSKRLKANNTQIDADKKQLSEKIVELTKYMEQKEISDKFSEGIRKQLYKKNTSINNEYKSVLNDYNIQKENNKFLDRKINILNTKVLSCERDRDKEYKDLDEIQRENSKLRAKTANINRLFNDVIAKIYKSFQTKNKNDVYKCACEIYRLFLTDEYSNTIKKKTLETNLLSEFNLQIKTLEKKVNLDKNYIKQLREKHSRLKRNKLNENASLLVACSDIKKRNVGLLKNIEDLSSEMKSLEDNKNNSTQIQNQSNFKKVKITHKSASAKDIFPPINNSLRQKNSIISENSTNEVV